MAAAVGPRVAERAVLRVHVAQDRVAVGAPAHIEGRVAHVAGVGVADGARAAGIDREDPVEEFLLAERHLVEADAQRQAGPVVEQLLHGDAPSVGRRRWTP